MKWNFFMCLLPTKLAYSPEKYQNAVLQSKRDWNLQARDVLPLPTSTLLVSLVQVTCLLSHVGCVCIGDTQCCQTEVVGDLTLQASENVNVIRDILALLLGNWVRGRRQGWSRRAADLCLFVQCFIKGMFRTWMLCPGTGLHRIWLSRVLSSCSCLCWASWRWQHAV